MSNEVNPAYSAVLQSDIVATYEAKDRAIKPLGLRIDLDEVGFHTHVISPYTVMKTPPWKLIVPTVCFDLCKYKKSGTDPTLYRLHYSELLESFTDYTHIFTDGSTGQVGLGVGSWPSNRATEGSNHKGTRLYFVILLKNVEKNL